MFRAVAACLLSLTLTQAAFAAPSLTLIPNPGYKLTFERVYSDKYFETHSYQLIKKTAFTVVNKGGHLTGKWTATIRHMDRDETIEGIAEGKCERVSAKKLQCVFDADAGMVEVTAKSDHITVSIPLGRWTRFDQLTDDGLVLAEAIFGFDEDNNLFLLNPKKSR